MSGFQFLNIRRAQEVAARERAILRRLASHDSTVLELAAAAQISRATADRYLNDHLRDVAFIHRWVYPHANGALCAVWRLGQGKNVPKPKGMQVRPEEFRDDKPDPEAWFDERAQRLRFEIQPFRHPMDAALFGPAP